MGDWGIGKQLRNFISTPNKRLRDLLNDNFDMYLIDEYGTSKYNYKTQQENKNMKVLDKGTGRIKDLHAVFTYKMSNKRIGCINRDKNAVNNMCEIVKSLIQKQGRPAYLRREKKVPTSSQGDVKCVSETVTEGRSNEGENKDVRGS